MEIYIYIFLIQLCAFIVKGIAGFGDPLISSPLLSIFLDNRQISPMNLCVQLPINSYIAWKNRKVLSVKKVLPIVVAIMIGIIPGTMLLRYSSALWLKVVLGVIIIGISIEMATRNNAKEIKYNKYVMMIISFFSGMCGGIFGINLFFVAYLERTMKDRNEFRGSICFVFLFDNVFRFISYYVTGIINIELVPLVLASVPGVLGGMLLARIIDNKLNDKLVKKAVITMFFLGGISTVVNAVLAMQ